MNDEPRLIRELRRREQNWIWIEAADWLLRKLIRASWLVRIGLLLWVLAPWWWR